MGAAANFGRMRSMIRRITLFISIVVAVAGGPVRGKAQTLSYPQQPAPQTYAPERAATSASSYYDYQQPTTTPAPDPYWYPYPYYYYPYWWSAGYPWGWGAPWGWPVGVSVGFGGCFNCRAHPAFFASRFFHRGFFGPRFVHQGFVHPGFFHPGFSGFGRPGFVQMGFHGRFSGGFHGGRR